MFKPMSRSDFEKRWNSGYTLPEPASLEEIAAIMAQVWLENPTLADTPRNHDLVRKFMEHNHCELTLEYCRIAVQALSYPKDQLDRRKPTPPPPPVQPVVVEPPPVDYAALTDKDELPIDTPSWRLRTATRAQLCSVVRRQHGGKQ